MVEPDWDLTPESVHRILRASKERGDEYFARKHKIHIFVEVLEGLNLSISTGRNTHFGIIFNEMGMKLKEDVPEGEVPFGLLRFKYYRKSRNTIRIFCNHPTNVFSDVFDFYEAVFDIKLEKLTIYPGYIRNYVVFLSRFVALKLYPLPILRVLGTVEDPQKFKLVLDSFKSTERAEIEVEVPLGFSYDFDFTGGVYIWNHGQWLNLDNLLNKRCQHLVALRTCLGNRDIVEYLNRWAPRAFRCGYEIVTLELREPVNMGAIMNGIQGCRLIAQGNHFSTEKRHILFTDGRLVLLDVAHDAPRKLNMLLYPQIPDHYEREHGHMLLI